jgi:hypothetical protein
MSYDFDSGSINPDFLRYNGIVDADWRVDGPVVAESGLSRVVYDNGLVVTASRDNVIFEQTGQPVVSDEFVSPVVAMRFMSLVPSRSGYEVVAVDPRGFIRLPVPEGTSGASATVLSALGARLLFEGEIPGVQARVSYDMEGREITLYVGEVESELRFSAHIHHHVVGSELSEQTAFVRTVLDSWKDDLADFDRLAIQFYHENIKGR